MLPKISVPRFVTSMQMYKLKLSCLPLTMISWLWAHASTLLGVLFCEYVNNVGGLCGSLPMVCFQKSMLLNFVQIIFAMFYEAFFIFAMAGCKIK